MSKRAVAAIAAAVVVLAAWLFWPSKYSRVANLDSRGANIVAFGDSLTAGYGAQPGDDYPSRLGSMVGATILNSGVNGDTTASALARVQTDLVEQNPRVAIIGLGGNDFLQHVPLATTEQNLREIVRAAHSAGAMVVILGYRFPTIGASYESMYERVAKDERCLLIPDLLDGILSNPALKSDEIHPNARGYALMAERIAGPLKKLMKEARRRRPL